MKRDLGENLGMKRVVSSLLSITVKCFFFYYIVEMPSDDESKKKGLLERCLISCCPAFGVYRREHDLPAFGDIDAKRFVIQTGPVERQDIYYTGPAVYEDRDNDEIVSIGGADVKMLSQQRNQVGGLIVYTLHMRFFIVFVFRFVQSITPCL